jgi:hypothetical protein
MRVRMDQQAEHTVTFKEASRRTISVASFNPDAYEDLRDNRSATIAALGVVVVATLLAAIGGLLWARFAAETPEIYVVDIERFLVRSVIVGSLLQIFFWLVWVWLTWFFLKQIYLVADVDLPALVRTMGFAFVPMAIQIFLVFPVLEFPIGLFALGATAACSVLAVRAASGVSQGQALVATMCGFLVFVIALGLLGNSDTDLAPGIFALDPNSISVGLRLDR